MKPTPRLALMALGGGLLAAVSAAFISALPIPFDRLNLPLVLACGLVAVFRPAESLAVAAATGIVLDAMSVTLPGLRLTAAVTAVLLANLIFRRFLANLNWPSFAALNVIAFAAYSVIISLAALTANRLAGFPPPIGFREWGIEFLAAIGLQVAVALLGLWLSRIGFAWFRSRYFYSRYAR